MQTLTLAGSAFEMGKRSGEAWARSNPGAYKPWMRWPGDPERRAAYRAMLGNMADYMAGAAPEIAEGIRGVAEGAGIPWERALLLNAGNSLGPAYGHYRPDTACTSVGFTTSDAGPILGKTDDGVGRESYAAGLADRQASLCATTVLPDEGHPVLCISPAGALWAQSGVNAAGLCLGCSSGHPQRSSPDARGIPQHLLPRLVLQRCATVAEAIDCIAGIQLAGKGMNLTLVDRSGQAASLDVVHDQLGVRRASQGAVFNTNHYSAPNTQAFGAQIDPDFISTRYYQNSVNRFVSLRERFGDGRELTLAEMEATLADHTRPGAVCQHGALNPAGWQTYFGAIAISHRAELRINLGHPCRRDYEVHSLAG